eukprot:527344_1
MAATSTHGCFICIVACLSLIQRSIKADHILCNTTHPCATVGINNITCAEDGDCLIECIGDSVCYGLAISCARSGDCFVHCNGTNACYESPGITCPDAPYSCTVECEGIKACYETPIGSGSWYPPNPGGNLVVRCLGPERATCEWNYFVCPSAPYTCNITCFGCYDVPTILGQDSGGVIVDCSFPAGDCRYGEIYCPTGDYPCVVSLRGGWNFRDGQIYGGGGPLLLDMDSAASQAYLYCPTNAECNITCVSPACLSSGTFIDARPSSVLNFFIETSEQMTSSSSTSEIYCPADVIGGSQNCNIYVSNPQGFVTLTEVEFWAVEGIHDLNFICDHENATNCTYFNASDAPIVKCLEDYSTSCTLGLYPVNATPSAVDWRCTDNTSICNTYMLPTPDPSADPTMEPTGETQSPTLSYKIVTKTPSESPIIRTLTTAIHTTEFTFVATDDSIIVFASIVAGCALVLLLVCICNWKMYLKRKRAFLKAEANAAQSAQIMHQSATSEEKRNDDDNADEDQKETGEESRSEKAVRAPVDDDDACEGQNYNELIVWMKNTVGLEEYIEVMIENGFGDMNDLAFMTMEDLKEMGVTKLAHRRRIYTLAQQKCQKRATDAANNAIGDTGQTSDRTVQSLAMNTIEDTVQTGDTAQSSEHTVQLEMHTIATT